MSKPLVVLEFVTWLLCRLLPFLKFMGEFQRQYKFRKVCLERLTEFQLCNDFFGEVTALAKLRKPTTSIATDNTK